MSLIREGRFDQEIVPIAEVTMDETPRESTLEKMAALNNLFGCDKVTAAVSSQTCDGASAVLIVSDDVVRRVCNNIRVQSPRRSRCRK